MDTAVLTGVVTGAFTLGGVVAGGGLAAWRDRNARRHGAARERDAQFTALGQACVRLQAEVHLERSLRTTPNKLRQTIYGALESDALSGAMGSNDLTTAAIHFGAAAIVHGLRYLYPTEQVAQIRRDLLPALGEVTGAATQLSMVGDERLQGACLVLANAAYELVGSIDAPQKEHQQLQDAVSSALADLRNARDLAALSRWQRRRRLRAQIDQPQLKAITAK